jgi:RNA polymerase sigma factor (sigma-70 family)
VGRPSIETMFRAHRGLVLGYLLRRTGDRATAEDLAQDTFLRATRAILGWRGGRPEAWLLAIARNVLVDAQRRGRPTLPLEEGLPAVGEGDPATGVAVKDVLRRLPDSQARLLTLVHVDGFTHAEVARMIGTTPAAVKTGVWRAREAFRRVYESEANDELPHRT